MNWYTWDWKEKFTGLSYRSILKQSSCFLGIFIGHFNWTIGDQMINLQPKPLCLRTKPPSSVNLSSAQALHFIYRGCIVIVVRSRSTVWASQAGAKPPNPNLCHCWKESGRLKQSDSWRIVFKAAAGQPLNHHDRGIQHPLCLSHFTRRMLCSVLVD